MAAAAAARGRLTRARASEARDDLVGELRPEGRPEGDACGDGIALEDSDERLARVRARLADPRDRGRRRRPAHPQRVHHGQRPGGERSGRRRVCPVAQQHGQHAVRLAADAHGGQRPSGADERDGEVEQRRHVTRVEDAVEQGGETTPRRVGEQRAQSDPGETVGRVGARDVAERSAVDAERAPQSRAVALVAGHAERVWTHAHHEAPAFDRQDVGQGGTRGVGGARPRQRVGRGAPGEQREPPGVVLGIQQRRELCRAVDRTERAPRTDNNQPAHLGQRVRQRLDDERHACAQRLAEVGHPRHAVRRWPRLERLAHGSGPRREDGPVIELGERHPAIREKPRHGRPRRPSRTPPGRRATPDQLAEPAGSRRTGAPHRVGPGSVELRIVAGGDQRPLEVGKRVDLPIGQLGLVPVVMDVVREDPHQQRPLLTADRRERPAAQAVGPGEAGLEPHGQQEQRVTRGQQVEAAAAAERGRTRLRHGGDRRGARGRGLRARRLGVAPLTGERLGEGALGGRQPPACGGVVRKRLDLRGGRHGQPLTRSEAWTKRRNAGRSSAAATLSERRSAAAGSAVGEGPNRGSVGCSSKTT